MVSGNNKIWAADLADMKALSRENEGINFLLLVIDIFNKYGWIKPLKNKEGETVAKALKDIFKESGRRPAKLWTDKGREFFNRDVKDLVELYATENEEKSSIVERWIRTMKEKIWKYFTDNNTYTYIDVLPDLVEDYNNTVHSSTKLTPVEASKEENELKVWRNLYPNRYKTSRLNPKFSVGDEVRITKKRIYHKMDRGNFYYKGNTRDGPHNLCITGFRRRGNYRNLLQIRITKDETTSI